jgi:hypothetical protein
MPETTGRFYRQEPWSISLALSVPASRRKARGRAETVVTVSDAAFGLAFSHGRRHNGTPRGCHYAPARSFPPPAGTAASRLYAPWRLPIWRPAISVKARVPAVVGGSCQLRQAQPKPVIRSMAFAGNVHLSYSPDATPPHSRQRRPGIVVGALCRL